LNMQRLRESLKEHEGKRLKVYNDSVGIPTIGYGRNLQGVGISDEEADYLLTNDITRAWQGAMDVVPTFAALTDARQEVLVEMCFNLGVAGLSKFRKTLGYIAEKEWDAAAREMLDSKWAEQVKSRAQRLAVKFSQG
jgi:lysozyme